MKYGQFKQQATESWHIVVFELLKEKDPQNLSAMADILSEVIEETSHKAINQKPELSNLRDYADLKAGLYGYCPECFEDEDFRADIQYGNGREKIEALILHKLSVTPKNYQLNTKTELYLNSSPRLLKRLGGASITEFINSIRSASKDHDLDPINPEHRKLIQLALPEKEGVGLVSFFNLDMFNERADYSSEWIASQKNRAISEIYYQLERADEKTISKIVNEEFDWIKDHLAEYQVATKAVEVTNQILNDRELKSMFYQAALNPEIRDRYDIANFVESRCNNRTLQSIILFDYDTDDFVTIEFREKHSIKEIVEHLNECLSPRPKEKRKHSSRP
tara:strand:+ start:28573 stop:29577 length:1005 start_codon:yes stop_codon:yes gene_type:complete